MIKVVKSSNNIVTCNENPETSSAVRIYDVNGSAGTGQENGKLYYVDCFYRSPATYIQKAIVVWRNFYPCIKLSIILGECRAAPMYKIERSYTLRAPWRPYANGLGGKPSPEEYVFTPVYTLDGRDGKEWNIVTAASGVTPKQSVYCYFYNSNATQNVDRNHIIRFDTKGEAQTYAESHAQDLTNSNLKDIGYSCYARKKTYWYYETWDADAPWPYDAQAGKSYLIDYYDDATKTDPNTTATAGGYHTWQTLGLKNMTEALNATGRSASQIIGFRENEDSTNHSRFDYAFSS